jgi:hypothetical protein
MAALRAGDDRQTLLLGHLRRLEAHLDGGRIHAHRLLGEDVLARFDRGAQVHRAEGRRRRQDHVVDVAGEHLLVGVPADELAVGGHGRFLAVLRQVLQALLQAILEHVAHRDEAHARRGLQHIVHGAGACRRSR